MNNLAIRNGYGKEDLFGGLFESFFGDRFFGPPSDDYYRQFAQSSFTIDSGLPWEIPLPGVKRESVSVSLEGAALTVEFVDRKGRKCREWRMVGDVGEVRARLADGLLTITAEKPNAANRVEVKVE